MNWTTEITLGSDFSSKIASLPSWNSVLSLNSLNYDWTLPEEINFAKEFNQTFNLYFSIISQMPINNLGFLKNNSGSVKLASKKKSHRILYKRRMSSSNSTSNTWNRASAHRLLKMFSIYLLFTIYIHLWNLIT